MAYYGKIARLPRSIRDELNRRLDNGEPGVRLIKWLNSLPEVQKLLQTDFDGRAINHQNLTEWKAKGYLEWQAQQETLALTREFKASAGELAAESGDGELTKCLAAAVTARYAAALHGWNGEMTDEMRSKLRGLRGLSREVVRLHRSDQTLERMQIQREWLALGSKASDLNQRRYQDSRLSDGQKALKFCLDQTADLPESERAFEQAFVVFDKERAAKNAQNQS
jgi:hypothetical protein